MLLRGETATTTLAERLMFKGLEVGMITRREWLTVTIGGAAGALVSSATSAVALPSVKPIRMTVYNLQDSDLRLLPAVG
jgi:hypothetical protein